MDLVRLVLLSGPVELQEDSRKIDDVGQNDDDNENSSPLKRKHPSDPPESLESRDGPDACAVRLVGTARCLSARWLLLEQGAQIDLGDISESVRPVSTSLP